MKKIIQKQNILFSIVVCTYNREKHIEKCLDSLVNQNFPKDMYEIIVVDDGSTDSTSKIFKKYPLRLIKHTKNKGIAAARNSGLKAAKGKIYICFDDDCFADRNWLKNLARAYEKYNPNHTAGIAGYIKLKNKPDGIIDKYMAETGYANPSPLNYVTSKSLFSRFYAYLKNMFSPNTLINEKMLEVGEIWGANCSFPVEILKKVKGWDEKLSGVEDADICDRIKKKFPDKKFICTKSAIIYHDHQLSLFGFLNKPINRGPAIFAFYSKNSKIPPIFPFPVAILLITIMSGIINPILILSSLLYTPLIFYSWWGIKAVKKLDLDYLAFPYLQVSFEGSTILGLFKGIAKQRRIL